MVPLSLIFSKIPQIEQGELRYEHSQEVFPMPTASSLNSKVIRYERPSLEIEYDQQALTASGCCRYVPVIVRICGIPVQQHVILTVMFERTRKKKDGVPLDDYEVHPTSHFLVHKGIPGYCEYIVELLARAHDEETGTIRIKMESQAYNLLSEAVFHLDSRQTEPVATTLKPGSFKALRLLPRIRTDEERNALGGQFPLSAETQDLSVAQLPATAQDLQVPLFPLE